MSRMPSRRSTPARGISRLTQQFKWSLKFHGLGGTAVNALAGGLKLVGRGLGMRERCLRWKERQFDARFGVDTADPVPLDRLDIAEDRKPFAAEYAPTSPVRFCRTVSDLGIAYGDYTFVDFGSGKGRVLLLASEFPFKRVVGVELSETLHRIAERNIASYRSRSQRCRAVESVCSDVTAYTFPADPAVFFLFNPFNGDVLAAVLANLRRSLQQAPRHVIVVYFNPVHRRLLDAADFLVDLGSEDESWALYESRPAPPDGLP